MMALEVLKISVPIFALIAFGHGLRRGGMLNPQAHAFLSRFVYLFSLPVLIFMGVAPKDFRALLDVAVIASTIGATFGMLAAGWLLARGLPRRLRGPVAISGYFANTAYIGFPLAFSAFGEQGLVYAGVINAFTMPVFIVSGVLVLGSGQADRAVMRRQLRVAVTSPVVLAAFAGLAASLLLHEAGLASLGRFPVIAALTEMVVRIGRMLGNVGLPMALITVGASLRFDRQRPSGALLSAACFAKLVVAPLLTLAICRFVFPGMPAEAAGTAVLLMACPLAVGAHIIGCQMDSDSDFLAAVLVITTVAAAATTPLWLGALMAPGG
jgi:predicted permease